uniref:non-specific serine/threonine protein kinase n=1 Tax=Leersia perrieri TaxID=77586 RepID=A0A0D9XVI7_9ORYZ
MHNLRHINLGGNYLSGTIPSLLFSNSSADVLSYINLGNNSLSGPIPSAISYLPMLQVLVLKVNHISGSLPPTLFNMSRLELLAATRNDLSGPITFPAGNQSSSLPIIQIMELGGNRFTGRIPSGLVACRKLQILDLGENLLVDRVPEWLADLSQLSILSLGGNDLVGSIPAVLSNLTMLTVLDLSICNLTGTIPMELGKMIQLTYLSVGANHLTGPFPTFLGNLTELSQLVLYSNLLTGPVPRTLGNLRSLQLLDISENHLQGKLDVFFAALSNCRQLQVLYFAVNSFSGTIPEGLLANLSSNLVSFDAGSNNLTGSIPPTISNLSNLNVIGLAGNQISGMIPESLVLMENLHALDISTNSMFGSIPAQIGTTKHMVALYLDDNNFSGSIPNSIGIVSTLQHLLLSYNSLSSTIPASLVNLSNLLKLGISHNNLNGALPSDLSPLKAIDLIDISANNLVGSLTTSFGQLEITYLNLSHNTLNDSIPNSFKGLISLATLDLSHNNLSGGIPKYFANLTYLTSLDLSFNNLQGQIPNGGVFSNITRRSLMGNAGLCGAPRLGFSPCLDNSHSTSKKHFLKFVLPAAIVAFGAIVMVLYLMIGKKMKRPDFAASFDIADAISHRALLLQLMPNGSLESFLHTESRPCVGSFLKRTEIMLDVSMAMEYLHHEHYEVVVHCDLKPSNVLFDEEMTAHVADFGIAKLLLGEDNSTVSASMPGTIGYMAPEYAHMGKASRKSDAFSFRIMLFEVFTGKRPTDPMFIDGLTLRQWVSRSFPETLIDVTDKNLLQDEETRLCFDHQNNSLGSSSISRSNSFLTSIFELGLLCSSELPEQRMAMNDVVTKLKHIKKDYSVSLLAMKRPRQH